MHLKVLEATDTALKQGLIIGGPFPGLLYCGSPANYYNISMIIDRWTENRRDVLLACLRGSA